MDDLQAIRRLKHGDLGGLEILMQRYQVKAARAAFLITYDESIAQDIVQETFIRIYQRIHQFDESRQFEPYLIRSVIHAAINVVRGSGKFTSLDDRSDDITNLLDRAVSVESQVESARSSRFVISSDLSSNDVNFPLPRTTLIAA